MSRKLRPENSDPLGVSKTQTRKIKHNYLHRVNAASRGGRVMYPRMHHFQVYYQSRLVTWSDHFEHGCIRGGSMWSSDASENDAFIFVLLRYGACFGITSPSLPFNFLNLNVFGGMLVFLEPFFNGGLLSSRKASRTHGTENLIDDRGFA